jgi:multicomponent Na+:H+ antiporter subunit C
MSDTNVRIYLIAGGVVFAIGVYSLIVQPHLLRRILALNVMGVGVFLVLVALAALTPGKLADPVPHAMVLTGIVVSVCATGLALALADQVQAATGRPELAEDQDSSSGLAPAPASERSAAPPQDQAES